MMRILRTADTGGTRIAMPQQSEEPQGRKSTRVRSEHSSFLQLFLEATRDENHPVTARPRTTTHRLVATDPIGSVLELDDP